jgi:hypothetical protein
MPQITWEPNGARSLGDEHGPIYEWIGAYNGRRIKRHRKPGTTSVTVYATSTTTYPRLKDLIHAIDHEVTPDMT